MKNSRKFLKRSRLIIKTEVKKEKGITLIALVITVIIMLILAGVVITAVIDSDGLFNRTREATGTYENAVKSENDKIQSMINEMDNYIDEISYPNNPIVKNPAMIGTK